MFCAFVNVCFAMSLVLQMIEADKKAAEQRGQAVTVKQHSRALTPPQKALHIQVCHGMWITIEY